MDSFILSIATDGTAHLIGAIVALAGAVGFLFKLYDGFRKEERDQLIKGYEKQLDEKKDQIDSLQENIRKYIERENEMSEKLIQVLEHTADIARDNLKNVQKNG